MAISKELNGAYNTDHPYLEIKEVPSSLVALRAELMKPHNHDIMTYAAEGKNFGECMSRIATFLGVAVDGLYDVGPLCSVLLTMLRERKRVPVISTEYGKGLLLP